MRIILKESYNGNRVLECLRGDSIIYDLTTLWAIGRWEGSDFERLDSIKKIQIPYNNILFIEDEGFKYDEFTINEEMQLLNQGILAQIKRIFSVQHPEPTDFSHPEPTGESSDVQKMIAQKKKELENKISVQMAEVRRNAEERDTIKEGKLTHPGRHRHPTTGIPKPPKRKSKLPFILDDKKDK